MTSWKKVKYIRRGESFDYDYEIMLPEPLANWDVFDYWEKERVISMRDNLTRDDILFDIGAEHGWLSVVYAEMCNVFLIEPTPEFWPNIRHTWHKNRIDQPVGCFCGLIGDKSNCTINDFSWPKECDGELIDKNKYLYLNQCSENTKILSVDDLVKQSDVKPTALTIDVEGFELLVLKGAKKLLSENDIKVWVSVHDDLAHNIGIADNEVEIYMNSLGYVGTHLATDHEKHMLYVRK